ncbi:MAG TPA: response regulator transcription factor [Terriglobia bacterium]|nr:response regulator transcription factor [Terriglobia bacterium]
MPLRILLAEDNDALRSELRALLESRSGWEVVAEAENGRDAVQKAGQVRPDVLVIDYSMPNLDGISAIPELRRVAPEAEVVLLTVHDARFTMARAMDAGARGYVVKSQIMKDLMPAIEAASKHQTYLSFDVAGKDRTAGQMSPIKKSDG